MATQNEGKDTNGRSWDQLTNGTTSAASMGAGSTGDVGANAESKDPSLGQQQGGMQQAGQGNAGRTDDLLAGGSDDEQADQGFQGGASRHSAPGGDRQGESNTQDAQGAAGTDDDQYDQGTARRESR